MGTYRTFLELSFTHFTSETWAFFKGFGIFRICFCQKRPLPCKITFWKYNGESKFNIFFLVYQNAPIFFVWIKICTFSFQICSWNKFWLHDVVILQMPHLCQLDQMRALSVWPPPKVKNCFQKQIWNDKVRISFWSMTKKLKNGLTIVFSKLVFVRGLAKQILKRPKPLEYA